MDYDVQQRKMTNSYFLRDKEHGICQLEQAKLHNAVCRAQGGELLPTVVAGSQVLVDVKVGRISRTWWLLQVHRISWMSGLEDGSSWV